MPKTSQSGKHAQALKEKNASCNCQLLAVSCTGQYVACVVLIGKHLRAFNASCCIMPHDAAQQDVHVLLAAQSNYCAALSGFCHHMVQVLLNYLFQIYLFSAECTALAHVTGFSKHGCSVLPTAATLQAPISGFPSTTGPPIL
jgi:hypothetical protein